MAERLYKKYYTVTSEAVQGHGSYVKFARPSYGEMTAVREIKDGSERTTAFVTLMVAEWNWVDDDGAALPLPKDDPETLARLTNQEMQFLVTHCVSGITEQEAKN